MQNRNGAGFCPCAIYLLFIVSVLILKELVIVPVWFLKELVIVLVWILELLDPFAFGALVPVIDIAAVTTPENH